jgi:hypothetical protein
LWKITLYVFFYITQQIQFFSHSFLKAFWFHRILFLLLFLKIILSILYWLIGCKFSVSR